jgi:hypothetical protein
MNSIARLINRMRTPRAVQVNRPYLFLLGESSPES